MIQAREYQWWYLISIRNLCCKIIWSVMISIYTRLIPDNTQTLRITLDHQRRQVNQRVHLEAIRCRLAHCKISETAHTCKQVGNPAALRMYRRRTTGRYTRMPAEREKTENCPYPFEKKNPRSEKTLKDTLSITNIHWKCQDVNKQSFYMWEIYSRFLVGLQRLPLQVKK